MYLLFLKMVMVYTHSINPLEKKVIMSEITNEKLNGIDAGAFAG